MRINYARSQIGTFHICQQKRRNYRCATSEVVRRGSPECGPEFGTLASLKSGKAPPHTPRPTAPHTPTHPNPTPPICSKWPLRVGPSDRVGPTGRRGRGSLPARHANFQRAKLHVSGHIQIGWALYATSEVKRRLFTAPYGQIACPMRGAGLN